MKKTFFLSAVIIPLLMSGSVLAEPNPVKAERQDDDGWTASPEKAKEVETQTVQQLEQKTKEQRDNILKLARSINMKIPNQPASGDYAKTMRIFGNWRTVCDIVFSQREYNCVAEQTLADSIERLVWRFGETPIGAQPGQKVAAVVFNFPADIDKSTPFKISSADGFEKAYPSSEWGCEGKMCSIAFILTKKTQGYFFEEKQVGFSYKLKSGEMVILKAPLSGLTDAIGKGFQDPSIQMRWPAVGKTGNTKADETKKPVAKPQKSG